ADPVLCVMEDSDLVSEEIGEPFFDEQGNLAPAVRQVRDFMIQVTKQRRATHHICAQLREQGLMQPWPFKRKTDTGEQIIDGLYRVDRDALRQLSAESFQALRQSGALPVIYCHLISMQHMHKLARLAQSRIQEREDALLAPDGNLDIEFLNQDGTVS